MRKHRKWWMGFGMGIMLGAIMLQLINAANLNNQALANVGNEIKYTQKQLDDEIAKALADTKNLPSPSASAAGTGSKTEPSKTPAASPSASSPASPVPSSSASSSASPSADGQKELAFYINNGMDLTTVARSLKRLGIIANVEDFTDEARTISKEIKPGTSRFTGKPDYKAIIAELTRVKDD